MDKEKQKGRIVSRETILIPVSSSKTADIISGDYDITRKKAQAIILGGPKGSTIVHFAAPGYKVLSNDTIIQLVEPKLKEAFGKLKVEYRKDGLTKSYMDYIVTDVKETIGKGDTVNPRIRVQNSYDGSLKFGFVAGAWRQVCTNGMVVGNIDKKLRFMHTASLDERIMDDVVEAMSSFIDNYAEATEQYKELNKQKIAQKDLAGRVDEVMEEIKFPKKQRDAVIEKAMAECKELGVPLTDWIVFNAFNFQLNHNTEIGMAEHKKTKLDGLILNFLTNN